MNAESWPPGGSATPEAVSGTASGIVGAVNGPLAPRPTPSVRGAPDTAAAPAVSTRIVGATLAVLSGSGVALLASLGIRILLARLLPPADVGLLLLGLALVTGLGSVASLGMNLPLTRRIAALRTAAAHGAARRTAQTAALTATASGLVATLVLFAAAPLLAPLLAPTADAPRLTAALRALCPVVVALPLGLAGLGINRGYGGVAARVLLRDALGGVLRIVGIAVAALLSRSLAVFGLGFSTAVLLTEGLFLSHGLTGARRQAATALAPHESPGRHPFDRTRLDRTLLASLPPFSLLELLYQAEQWLDLLVVGLFAAPREVALYGLARALTRSMDLVRTAAAHRFFPAAAGATQGGEKDRFADVYRRSRFLVLAILWLPLVACLAFPTWLMNGLFGAAYGPAGGLLRLLAVAVLLEGLFGFKDQSLVVLGREGNVLRVRLAAQMAGLAALLLAVPRLGALGAALAVLVAQVLRSGAFTVLLRRTGALPPLRREFPPRLLAALGITLAGTLAATLLPAAAAMLLTALTAAAAGLLLLGCAGLDLRSWRSALSS